MRKILRHTLLAPLNIPRMILSPLRIEWATYRQSKSTRSRFSHRLLRELIKAGWYEGRKITPGTLAKMYDAPVAFFTVPAMKILEEFAGLRIGGRGAFLNGVQDADARQNVSHLLGSSLSPFGVTAYYCDTGGLWVDEQGRIFVTNITNDPSAPYDKMLEYVAGSFIDALEFLAAGAKAPVWRVFPDNDNGVWYFKGE